MARFRKGRDDRQRLDPGWMFTAAWLRPVFIAAMTRVEPPGDAALEELATALNGWRSYFVEADAARLRAGDTTRAEAAMAELRAVLPGIANRLTARADQGDPIAAWYAPGIVRLADAVAQQVTFEHETLPDQVRDWRWLLTADALPAVIRRATGRDLGLSKTGPMVRIIEAIIPKMTGESRTGVAIWNQYRIKT